MTRKDYMNDSKGLHQAYHAQFVTERTKQFVLSHFTIEELLNSKDEHLNDLNKKNKPYYGLVWDNTPYNKVLMAKADAGFNTVATACCIGKACARMLINEALNTTNKEVL